MDLYLSLAAELLGPDCCPLLLPPESTHNIGGLSDQKDAQLCAVVCDRTRGMDAVTWRDLSEDQRIPWMEQALAWKPANHPAEVKAAKGRKVSLDLRALTLFADNPSLTNKEIAARLPCHVKSLTRKRCPLLAKARRKTKLPDSETRRGTKDKTGNVEAWNR
ncbi:MAG TPA: hypothetical protein VMR25_05010 [Planctomycetaceae bacterium]|jgi:hypothetical protein|nr:hypothetical protein [Planctomycetaceae bacterium]